MSELSPAAWKQQQFDISPPTWIDSQESESAKNINDLRKLRKPAP
ncbi:MAG: hypothetical protein R3B84_01425 [Zavarzinella sp.]